MKRDVVNRIAITAVFLALVYGLYALPFADWIEWVVGWAQQHPVVGPVAYLVIVVIATVLFVPGSVSMMIAGYLFGLVSGIVVAAIGIAAGAQCAFLVGRKGARHWVEERVSGNPRLGCTKRLS